MDSHLAKVFQKVPETDSADKSIFCALRPTTATSQLEQSCRKIKQENHSRLYVIIMMRCKYI